MADKDISPGHETDVKVENYIYTVSHGGGE
jgi:hypothetical protein